MGYVMRDKWLNNCAKRRAEVMKLRKQKNPKLTMEEIGDILGLTRQRVGQIIKKESAKVSV